MTTRHGIPKSPERLRCCSFCLTNRPKNDLECRGSIGRASGINLMRNVDRHWMISRELVSPGQRVLTLIQGLPTNPNVSQCKETDRGVMAASRRERPHDPRVGLVPENWSRSRIGRVERSRSPRKLRLLALGLPGTVHEGMESDSCHSGSLCHLMGQRGFSLSPRR